MKIVDARSGEVMSIGKKVDYPAGEFIRLLRIEDARVFLERAYRDFSRIPSGAFDAAELPLVSDTIWVPLIVRKGDHPSFLGQDVGFIPS